MKLIVIRAGKLRVQKLVERAASRFEKSRVVFELTSVRKNGVQEKVVECDGRVVSQHAAEQDNISQ